MANLAELDQHIENVREKLYALAERKNYLFADAEVMRLSEKLDVLIVQRERCKMGKK